MLEILKQTLLNAPVVKFNDYHYVVFPITDGIPMIAPDLLEEITDYMVKVGNLDCEKIVTAEAMGIHLATALSLKTKIPFTIIRKKKYALEDEVEFEQRTGYHSKKMYINGLHKGDRVIIIDDIISTGGTLRGILRTFRNMGVKVSDVLIVIDKGKARKDIDEEFGIKIKYLVGIEMVDDKVVIKELGGINVLNENIFMHNTTLGSDTGLKQTLKRAH